MNTRQPDRRGSPPSRRPLWFPSTNTVPLRAGVVRSTGEDEFAVQHVQVARINAGRREVLHQRDRRRRRRREQPPPFERFGADERTLSTTTLPSTASKHIG